MRWLLQDLVMHMSDQLFGCYTLSQSVLGHTDSISFCPVMHILNDYSLVSSSVLQTDILAVMFTSLCLSVDELPGTIYIDYIITTTL